MSISHPSSCAEVTGYANFYFGFCARLSNLALRTLSSSSVVAASFADTCFTVVGFSVIATTKKQGLDQFYFYDIKTYSALG